MTSTNRATAVPAQGRPLPEGGPLPDMLTELEAEFFVDWQVADDGPLPLPAPEN